MDDENAGKRLSAWLGHYTIQKGEWPLVVGMNGTVSLAGQDMLYWYDPGRATLTLPPQPWSAGGNFEGCTIWFSAAETPAGVQANAHVRLFSGLHLFGTAPVTKQYKASAADVKAIRTAYGIAMDDATCERLAAALPAFPPSPSTRMEANSGNAAREQVSWTTGAFIGALIGGTVGGIVGSLVPGAGTAAGAALGASLGATFGGGLTYSEDPQKVIEGVEHQSEHGCCVDVGKETYPVGWLPYAADLKSWRSYDPTTIPGVGILMRVQTSNGVKQLIGKNLMTMQEEVLVDRGGDGHYSWVFHPSQAIIYRWNSGAAIKKGNYIRHSQLGGGVPVICAGEWTLDQGQLGYMIATINDSSGHYKPDGGKCMGPVLNKLKGLGVNVDAINVTTV